MRIRWSADQVIEGDLSDRLVLGDGELRRSASRVLEGRRVEAVLLKFWMTDDREELPALLARPVPGSRGRVETGERTRLTVSARAPVGCRRRPRGARR